MFSLLMVLKNARDSRGEKNCQGALLLPRLRGRCREATEGVSPHPLATLGTSPVNGGRGTLRFAR